MGKKTKSNQKSKTKKKAFWKSKYKDYYGENPPFDLKSYEGLGRLHLFAEVIVYVLFALFFAWGAYNMWEIGRFVQSNYGVQIGNTIDQYEPYIETAKDYSWRVILLIVLIFFISLGLCYLIVRIFAELAMILMYGSLILQIGLFGYLYWSVNWEYNWIFLIPLGLNLLFLTIWMDKFKRAVKFLRNSCLVVSKERKLLYPYFSQTFLITLLSFFYFFIMIGYYFKLSPDVAEGTYTIAGDRMISVTDNTLFALMTVLFVFLTYFTYNTTKVMKILMVHAWYRGDSWRFWKTYKVTRFRFRYILTFSMLATIAHSFKTIKKILKGQWGPRTPKETMKLMKKVKPVDMETMDRKKKRKMSIWERMFQYINYYTLYSIAIENKNYFRGLIRSMHITLKNIPDLFVKKSHVNLVFRLMEYSMTFTNGLVGAIVGAALANYYGLSDHIAYAAAGGCVLFLWIGGSSTVLILNDLNMSYKTIMYIHTVDMLIDKKGYTRFELENPLSEKEMELLESEYNEKAKKKDEKKRRADKMEEN